MQPEIPIEVDFAMKIRSYPGAILSHLVVLFFLVTLLPGCIVVVDKNDHDDDDYYRRRWRLEVIVFSTGTYTPSRGSLYTVSFDNETTLSGRADCMDFEGRYEVGRTSTLTIDQLNSEEPVCGSDSIASVFLEELERARSMTGSADELVIHLEGSNDLMRFKPY